MIAWVLILAMGYNYSITISGIASQSECEALFVRMRKETIMGTITITTPNHFCFSYQAAK